MNYGAWLFFGCLVTFASSWIGLVFLPEQQLRNLGQTAETLAAKSEAAQAKAAMSATPTPPGQAPPAPHTFPSAYTPAQLAGRQVYIQEGCIYCHSQQIRGGRLVSDQLRGWGSRRTVPADYIHDDPALLGTMRTGPDLVNIGVRQSSDEWHYLHFYEPTTKSAGSIMPPFRYLFAVQPIGSAGPSPEALKLPPEFSHLAPPAGSEIVPTQRARDLVAYLKGLDRTYPSRFVPEGR